jgi:hypothetical protein
MAFSAISYRLRPGGESAAAELLRTYGTAGPDPAGGAGIRQAGAFVQDGTLVRAFQHEGDTDAVIDALIGSPDLVSTERQLAALAAEPPPAAERDAMEEYLRGHTMQVLQQRSIEERPDSRLAALRYLVRPGHAAEIAQVFADVQAEARPTLRNETGEQVGLILAVALFVRDDSMVRVVQYTGELDDVAQYMAKRGGRPDMERRLAPYMAEHRTVESREDFLAQFARNTMRTLPLKTAAAPVAN